jgi:exo-beta-1,3-glucanase (GH17 family)
LTTGNEAVYNGFLSGDELVSFIESSTTQLRDAGYSGIISTVETVGTYQANPQLCGAVESYIHANIHPYYDPNTVSSNAGPFVVSQQGIVESLCGLPVIVSETGWPWAGGTDGDAIASVEDQATAIASILSSTGGNVTFFSYSNDAWKAPGVEQNFGMSLILERP